MRRDLERLRNAARDSWAAIAIGVGSALTAAFLPAWVQGLSSGAALALGLAGALVLVLGVWSQLRATATRRGTAIVVYTPVEGEWGPAGKRWLQGATWFAGHEFRQVKTVQRTLPSDPGCWLDQPDARFG